MSVTLMYFTPEPVQTLTEAFGMDVLHHIPFCRGKTFTGDSRFTKCIGFPTPCVTVFINDNEHHSDDLFIHFALPGGSFYFDKEEYDHEIRQCVTMLENAVGIKHSGDVEYCSNGDVGITFHGCAPIMRRRILDDNRKGMLSLVG